MSIQAKALHRAYTYRSKSKGKAILWPHQGTVSTSLNKDDQKNKDILENEDNQKNQHDFNNEDNVNNEDNPQNGDM